MPLTGSISADASALLDALRALPRLVEDIPPAGPLREASTETGRLYLGYAAARYQRGGDGEWADLTEATKKAKARKGYDPDAINVGSGRLLDSLTPGAAENVLNPLPDGVEAGTSVPYAAAVDADRPFIVDPDAPTEAAMGQTLADGLAAEQEAGRP